MPIQLNSLMHLDTCSRQYFIDILFPFVNSRSHLLTIGRPHCHCKPRLGLCQTGSLCSIAENLIDLLIDKKPNFWCICTKAPFLLLLLNACGGSRGTRANPNHQRIGLKYPLAIFIHDPFATQSFMPSL